MNTTNTQAEPQKSFTELVSIKEIHDFLCKKPFSRRQFFQYTSIDGLAGMIRSSKLHLSKATKMNDLLECNNIDKVKWQRTYIASFTHTSLESIAMWCVYAKQLSESVRLGFLPSKIWKLTENARNKHIYQVYSSQNIKYKDIGLAEEIFLCDVSYLREHSLSLDGATIHERTCPDIHNILFDKSMLGLIKHSVWEYEKESRLCVVLPKNSTGKYPDKIAVDFDGINQVKIMGSPCINTGKLLNTLSTIKIEFKDNEDKQKIINSIRYSPEDKKNSISAIAGKLYLPEFCEKCLTKQNCKLYKEINA